MEEYLCVEEGRDDGLGGHCGGVDATTYDGGGDDDDELPNEDPLVDSPFDAS